MSDFELCYNLLAKVYKEGAYSNIELNKSINDAQSSAFVTRLFYGVLQKDTQLEYYIAKMCDKKPQKSIVILLKLAMYAIMYMDNTPNYAIVNNAVDLCESIGKRQQKAFVNAILQKFCKHKPAMPTDKVEFLSVSTSTPLWLVQEYVSQYGLDTTQEFLSVDDFELEHIRPNIRQLNVESLKKMLIDNNQEFTASQVGGFFVRNNKYINQLFNLGLVTFQSATSMLTVQAMQINNQDNVLDLCSAPGGKAVYISEITQDGQVTACDLHEHRVGLIKSYCSRMKANNVECRVFDATIFKPSWESQFDKVLCDVPCSGFGVATKKPDIYIDSSLDKVYEIAKVQYKILSNASRYVKNDGVLVYSTCTTLKQENSTVIEKFLKKHPEWQLRKEQQYLPDGQGIDGFFIASLVKKVKA